MKRFLLSLIILLPAIQAADWLTFAGDPQRTGWAKTEKALSTENVSKLRVEWSLKLDNAPVELNGVTVPVIVENATTPRGFKDIVVIAGSSNTAFAIDADTGKLLWQRKFQIEGAPKDKPHWLCPSALNATPVIDKSSRNVYIATADGRLHTLNYVNGEDQKPPIEFVPPFAKNWSMNLFHNVLYTTTSQGCNGVRSAVYAMNLKDPNRPVSKFVASPTGGAGIWGRAGGAISAVTGLIYAETGDGAYDVAAGKYSDTFLGVSAEGKLVDYYTPANRAWITKKDLDMGNISPVVFPFDQWELVAGAGKEGVLYLLDAKSLGGADHRTPLFRSPLLTNDDVDFAGRGFWGALSTWQDPKGTRWLYAPASGPPSVNAPQFPMRHGDAPDGSIMAFRVVVKDGKPVLDPAWISRNLSLPEPVAIANGVVFALSNGESARQVDSGGRLYTTPERIALSTGNTTLYAFDAETGKELFSSGKTIPNFTHFSGLAISAGRVYVVTHDSTVYAFSLPQ
jgi:outer membrane protein assembly factor BamB